MIHMELQIDAMDLENLKQVRQHLLDSVDCPLSMRQMAVALLRLTPAVTAPLVEPPTAPQEELYHVMSTVEHGGDEAHVYWVTDLDDLTIYLDHARRFTPVEAIAYLNDNPAGFLGIPVREAIRCGQQVVTYYGPADVWMNPPPDGRPRGILRGDMPLLRAVRTRRTTR